MPIAWYIVSTMSSISRRTFASTAATGFALILSRGSGAVMIGNRAMMRLGKRRRPQRQCAGTAYVSEVPQAATQN